MDCRHQQKSRKNELRWCDEKKCHTKKIIRKGALNVREFDGGGEAG